MAAALLFVLYKKRIKILSLRFEKQARMKFLFSKYNISEREQEIILLILKGKSNKEIEDELFISLKTVKNHIYNIYQKLKVNNRFQLINLLNNF